MVAGPPEAGIRIELLAPDRLTDFVAFFERDAFADNPHWAGCFCYFYLADHKEREFDQRTGEDNRTAVSELIHEGRMQGYLAYLGGRPVGWCHAAPRKMIPNVDRDEELAIDDADRVGSIVCFIVAKPQRGQGVGRSLLSAACEGLRKQGLAIAEAYPRKGAQGEAANYHGPLEMYLDAGFKPHRELEEVVIVRKTLAGD